MNEKNLFKDEHLKRIQNSHNLSDFVHDAIRDAIISGKLTPGLKLKQLVLAKQLDVSQQTVREALKRLVNGGLIVQKPNRGFAVTEIPVEEQDEIYEIRIVLEALAIKQAVHRLNDKDIARMRELLPFTASPDGNIDINTVREANREFHLIPIRATNKKHLIRILEQIWDLTWTYFYRENDASRQLSAKEDLEEHAEILLALENRDPEKAHKVMTRHLQNTKKSLLSYMDHV